MHTSIQLHSLPFRSAKTYLAAALFIAGNIILPQVFHLVNLGGPTWLPIYFFTLIGAYKFGWRVGLLTAVASPIANALLFGMPAMDNLSSIVIKSVLLAAMAGYASHRFRKASLMLLISVVLGYQVLGTLLEMVIKDSFMLAYHDFLIGIPGMILQIFGGWFVINLLLKR